MQSNYEEELIVRIGRCQQVISSLNDNSGWNIMIEDLMDEKQKIDDSWHMLPPDDKKISELRITKFAIMHLLNLKEKYEIEIKKAQDELEKVSNPSDIIHKDYDGE